MAEVAMVTVKDAGDVVREVATATALVALIGDVTASPPSNSLLDRLKVINTTLTSIFGAVDGLEGFTDGLEGFLDGVETLLTTANTNATTLQGLVDNLETYLDGVEGLIGTTNTNQAATTTAITAVTGTKAAGVAAASALLAAGVYNSTNPAPANGQQVALQLDSAGNLKVTGSGGGQQFAEDSAHASGDLGTMILGVRRDTQSTLAGTDGDYAPVQLTAAGSMRVEITNANNNARAAAANSAPVVLSTEDLAAVNAITTAVTALLTGPLKTGGMTVIKNLTMTIDTAVYASGDVIADTQQLDAAFRVADGSGVVQSLVLVDEGDQKQPLTIFFFGSSSTLGTENAAPSITDANAINIHGFVDIAAADYKDLGGVAVANIKNIGIPITAVSGTDDLYIAILNGSGAPDYVAGGDLKVRVGILQD